MSEYLLLIIIVGTPPINPGSIPSVGMNSHSVANRTSIGGGVAPTNFAQVRHYVLVSCFFRVMTDQTLQLLSKKNEYLVLVWFLTRFTVKILIQ